MSGFVFMGPTLPGEKAREILPEARLLPPVNGGDVLSLMKYKPSYVAVIDGNFGKRPSVWHKEILYALARGCAVFGAASMGALRAAELHRYGMVGIGRVFEWYRDSRIISDDEVALIHGPEATGYQPLSITLVDFRFAFEEAVKRGDLSSPDAEELLQLLSDCHFSQRSWDWLVAAASGPAARALRENMDSAWHSISIKRLDAEELLSYVARHRFDKPRTAINILDLHTSPMMTLIGRTLSRPVLFSGDWMYESDLRGRNLRLLPECYLMTSIVARILSLGEHSDLDQTDTSGLNDLAVMTLKMYVQLQVLQSLPSRESVELGSPFAAQIEGAYQRAGRLLGQYLSKAMAATSVSYRLEAKQRMLMNVGLLATHDSPNLHGILARFELEMSDLPAVLVMMLHLELFVLSYQRLDNQIPDLSVDWWGKAIRFLRFEELAQSLDEPSEQRSRARVLLGTKPKSYHLIRFGFQDGIQDLYDYL